MKKITHELRLEIQNYIKSGKDISPLIEGYSIKDENLSGAIIKKFIRFNQDCSKVNLSRALIGEEGGVVDITNCIFDNANLFKTRFLTKVIAHNLKARGANFNKTYVPSAEYHNADFTGGTTFCSAVFEIGTGCGKGAKFDKNVVQQLITEWVVE